MSLVGVAAVSTAGTETAAMTIRAGFTPVSLVSMTRTRASFLDVDGHTRGSLRAATGEEGGADDHAIRAVDGKREPVLRLASICRGRVTGCRGGDRRVRQQLLGGGPHLGELALDLGGGNLRLIGQALVMRDPRLFRDQANERRDGGDRQDRDGDEGQPEAQLDQPQAVAAIQDRIS